MSKIPKMEINLFQFYFEQVAEEMGFVCGIDELTLTDQNRASDVYMIAIEASKRAQQDYAANYLKTCPTP